MLWDRVAMILCWVKYIYNWVADDTMLCEIYL